jgi:hypothetical protein
MMSNETPIVEVIIETVNEFLQHLFSGFNETIDEDENPEFV